MTFADVLAYLLYVLKVAYKYLVGRLFLLGDEYEEARTTVQFLFCMCHALCEQPERPAKVHGLFAAFLIQNPKRMCLSCFNSCRPLFFSVETLPIISLFSCAALLHCPPHRYTAPPLLWFGLV